jgi:membrane-associated phospholipid phosphatase
MKTGYKFNLTLFIVFLVCFSLVVVTGIDKALFMDINSLGAYLYPFFWASLTFLGDTLASSVILILFLRKRPDLVWAGIIAAIIAALAVNLLKSFSDIPRPSAIIDKSIINIIGPALYVHSFPSGHTVTIFTLTGILMFYFRSMLFMLGMVFLALLIGISRIAVGVHWPADVLAGAALGILFAMTGVYSVTKLGWNKIKPLQLIIGFVLIVSNVYLSFFYDCKYEQAIYLQYFLAFAVLVAGIREYYLVLKDN